MHVFPLFSRARLVEASFNGYWAVDDCLSRVNVTRGPTALLALNKAGLVSDEKAWALPWLRKCKRQKRYICIADAVLVAKGRPFIAKLSS
jgi:hypothetical protein